MRDKSWLAILSLIGMAVVVFWRLALTELIVGRGDLFFYFYPYRDFASAAARAGRVPLWNPYLFMGAPFLANSQAGFFYPPNLALAWLPVERMVNASIVIHAGLAATGAYLWGRSGLRLGRSGAWLTGLCYGVGGYFVAQIEHLNQIQVLAWLPWLLWLFKSRIPFPTSPQHRAADAGQVGTRATRFAPGTRAPNPQLRITFYVLRIMPLALVIGLQFLAGHIQSVFICLVGLASYALFPPAWDVVRRRVSWCVMIQPFFVVVGAAAWGGALTAVQLLPTFELTGLSIRSGGLLYKEAVSFSLRPDLVGRALLPGWGASLFPEFVAYVGVVGLGLTGMGALASWRGVPPQTSEETVPMAARGELRRSARRGALLLAALGLFLALGGFNPVYFVLVKLVPGFGLFRAPARWLALYAIGVAGLVGIGWEEIAAFQARRGLGWRRWAGLALVGGGVTGLVLLGQLLGDASTLADSAQTEAVLAPSLNLTSVLGWLTVAFIFGIALYLAPNSQLPVPNLLLFLITIELLGASLFLPINRATAPGALTSLRPAVAHLRAEAETATIGPPARFLSISDIFFDPGDKPEIEIALGPQLSDDALYDYLIATKQKEVLIPNLPLYFRLPAMDGYDGGVLPLRNFVTLERLYMPEENVAIDGRLRENLDAVPDGRWLSLFNVRFLVTDKVGDAWFDGVFYDLQMGARLGAGDEAVVGHVPSLDATSVGVVYRVEDVLEGTSLAEVDVAFADGRKITLPLLAEMPAAGEERVARLSWGAAGVPVSIRVRGTWGAGQVAIRGLSLIDERTGAFQSLVLSNRGRYRLVHSGDVKIYENLDVRPRLIFLRQAVAASDDEAALALMREPDFDPFTAVVLSNPESRIPDPGSHSAPLQGLEPRIPNPTETDLLLYEPERVIANIVAPADGWLLLSDAWYPGWEARVDGRPVPVERADVLFRAVAVPAGQHRVEWFYRPQSLCLGVAISVGGLLLLLAGGVWFGLLGLRQHLL